MDANAPPKRRGRPPRQANATPAPTAEMLAVMPEMPQVADLPKGWRWEILG
jgi:hypothetical protein